MPNSSKCDLQGHQHQNHLALLVQTTQQPNPLPPHPGTTLLGQTPTLPACARVQGRRVSESLLLLVFAIHGPRQPLGGAGKGLRTSAHGDEISNSAVVLLLL